MQLVPEGPNIPESLLNAQAEGDVVFFCGAGVSVDAGYPLFGALVEGIRRNIPITDTPELQESIKNEDYEFALSIIQSKLGKNSIHLRRETEKILSRKPKTLKNHRSILRLSRLRDGRCRLITTNFDRLFIKAARKLGTVRVDSAPKLPVPKADRWDSILHLHGLLPAKPNNPDLHNLVLTSADFGEAYVTSGYCSRFLVELLRNFTVVFIGYSLNDRIMRYLLDAISCSEKFYGETQDRGHFKKPYAFVEHNENNRKEEIQRWNLKEVTPIPYFVEEALRRKRGSHHRLYDTLDAWADLAVGGQNARVTLALNEATKPHLAEDTFGQARLLWALRDENGKAVKALATADTREKTASIDWLPFFAKNGLLDQVYSSTELQALSSPHPRNADNALEQRYLGSVTRGNGISQLKPVSANLLRWMQWHLGTVELVDWILANGAVPHPAFSQEYCRPKESPPHPSGDSKRLWDILTSDAYALSQLPASQWFGLRENLDFTNRSEALEFLTHVAPKLSIKPSMFRGLEGHRETCFAQFDFELKLRNDEIDDKLGQIISNPELYAGLEALCEELTQLVKSGLDWLSLVDVASEVHDYSGYSIPSISPHAQNEYVQGFGQLVFLLRTAFDRRLTTDPEGASRVADLWALQNYPLFKRLFLYAANKCGPLQDRSALELLRADEARWLWAIDTTREVNVYLRERVRHWKSTQVSRLCCAILKGPARESYQDMSDTKWPAFRDRRICRHLSKLEQGGVTLSKRASARFARLQNTFPFSPPEDNSDEFVIYSGSDGDREQEIDPTALHKFMRMMPGERVKQWIPVQWRLLQGLALSDPEAALKTLEKGLQANVEDENFWGAGISGLARAIKNMEPYPSEMCQMIDEQPSAIAAPPGYLYRMLNILRNLPDGCFQSRKVADAIIEFWQKSSVNSLSKDEYLEIWDSVWAASAKHPSEERDPKGAVNYAINDLAGKLTEALLQYLWPKSAKAGSGIPQELASRLKRMVKRASQEAIDASSVIVASRTEILYAVAPEFTQQNILPLLSWDTNPNAAAYWSAFLWQARVSPDLFKLIQADCLTALRAPERFEDGAYKTLCQLVLLASMEFKAITEDVVRGILDEIGTEGLQNISSCLRRRLLNSKEDAGEYWMRTVRPWINTHWPREAAKQTTDTMQDFAMIAVYCDDYFPEALRLLEDSGLLGLTPQASTIVFSLRQQGRNTHQDFERSSTLPERFPKEVLHLLWITRAFPRDHGCARDILDRITKTEPQLANAAEYQELSSLLG